MLNLLDSENDGIGLNMFNENIDDPQATNALNCNIIGEMDEILNVNFFFKKKKFISLNYAIENNKCRSKIFSIKNKERRKNFYQYDFLNSFAILFKKKLNYLRKKNFFSFFLSNIF